MTRGIDVYLDRLSLEPRRIPKAELLELISFQDFIQNQTVGRYVVERDRARAEPEIWRNCWFDKTRLTGGWERAEFQNCLFTGVVFREANLRLARFHGCQFFDCRWQTVDIGASYMSDRTEVRGTSFQGLSSDVRATWRANFTGCTFGAIHMVNVSSSWLNLMGHVTRCDFAGASDLTMYNFGASKLWGCTFPTDDDYLQRIGIERTDLGLIAYKTFGVNYLPREDWLPLEPYKLLTDMDGFNPHREQECAVGINVGNIEWVLEHARTIKRPSYFGGPIPDVWRVLIPEDAKVCIPYSTDGKFRADRVRLMENLGPAFVPAVFRERHGFPKPAPVQD